MVKIFHKYSEIKGRIVEYLDTVGISKEKFYARTGISPTNFRGKQAQSELGGEKIAKILTEFNNLSPDWLILGYGSMTRESYSSPNIVMESPERYKPPPDDCKLCQEKERTIEAMRVANEALQTALSALKNSGRYSNSRESSTSKQTG